MVELDDLIEQNQYKESNIYKVELGKQIGRCMELGSEDTKNDKTAKIKHHNAITQFEILLSPMTGLKLYNEGETYNETRNSIINSESEEKFLHLFNLCMNNLSDTGILPTKTKKDKDFGDTDFFRAFAVEYFKNKKK